ncbi:MAG: TIM barrel protein [Sphaerochaeta sp.]|nr:TIM barrel protein [Sphaerochaeta sp.]
MKAQPFALNRIIAPQLEILEFIALAKRANFQAVELRNDLEGRTVTDALKPHQVEQAASVAGLHITTINALQRFNENPQTHMKELEDLLKVGKILGCDAIVLCPVNGIAKDEDRSRWYHQCVEALVMYSDLFGEYGLLGYVEPLGFAVSSLQTKKEALRAIKESGKEERYKLVHDTFHHYLGGEKDFYPQQTGIVHLSAVVDEKPMENIQDSDRVLLSHDDILSSQAQVRALAEGGYNGYLSFEPFSSVVQQAPLEALLKQLRENQELLS